MHVRTSVRACCFLLLDRAVSPSFLALFFVELEDISGFSLLIAQLTRFHRFTLGCAL